MSGRATNADPDRPQPADDDNVDLAVGGEGEVGERPSMEARLASREADLEVERDTLTAAQRAALARLTQRRRRGKGREAKERAAAPATIPRRPAAAPAELSFAQQRLWFLDQFEPATAIYNIPAGVHLSGRLEVVALGRSLDEIVRRHQVLRTTFGSRDGWPEPVLGPPRRLTMPLVDLRRLNADARRHEAQRLTGEEARRPFDLVRGPLLRVTLLELEAEAGAPERAEHLLLLTVHHIVSDAWSVAVFVDELGALYRAFAAGQASPLPALPIQYADFAHWQRRQLRGEVLERELAYWRRQLAGAPAEVALPTDRPRPPVPSYRGRNRHFAWPPALARGLEAVSRGEQATMFMTLLAALTTLVFRYSGQRDLPVGTPIANRNRSEIEGLIGFFVNTLVLRTDLSAAAGSRDPSFAQILARVRETALEAFAHQDLPFEALVEDLRPERDQSRAPLFQLMFGLENIPLRALELPGLRLRHVVTGSRTAKFDLTLFMRQLPAGFEGRVEYATDLFDQVTIARLSGHLRVLLEAIVRDPGGTISSLPLIGAAERWQLLGEWNDTAERQPPICPPPGEPPICPPPGEPPICPPPGEPPICPPPGEPVGRCVHELFEAQAERTPEAVAVVDARQALSYRELNRRANRLAHHLRALGVGPEVRVGVCMERTAEMVVGLLGTLKAGGGYVPLDPSYPAERIAFMLEDAGVRAVLAHEPLAAALPEHRAHLVRLDADRDAVAGRSPEDPPAAATPAHLAYLIYTSGSTGRAKGVAVAHRSTVAMLRWAREVYSPAELGGVLASTSICFDISIFELFLPLVCGGRVILATNALELPELPAAAAVTLVNTVPSALRELLRLAPLPPGVRTVNLAGEPLPRALVDAAYRQPGVERVFNLYGPSEDTTYSTFARIARTSAAAPPIGRPLDGTAAYVLDRRLRPSPQGVPGELYLAGEGLARGYLERPRLSAERWLPDPFGDRPGRRMYRTGDLVRTLPGGELAFLGRLDHQVKLRGFRVELGEIETVLERHPGVGEAVVVVRREAPVAYVVRSTAAPELDAGTLRAYAAEHLPPYMVPAVLMFLEALPLTPNGKVDRRALPAPEPSSPPLAGSRAAPRRPLEELVAGIWSQVLGSSPPPGVHDNFFALGGHSLLATQVVSRIRQQLGVEVPLRRLFERPTVAGMAAYLGAERRRDLGPAAPPIRPRARDRNPPLSFAQQRLWFLDQFEPGSPLYHMPGVLDLRGALDPALLAAALGEIVRRHEVLRTTFALAGEEPVQVIHPAAAIPLPLVDLTALPAAARQPTADALAGAETRTPFDLTRGPLHRTMLLRLAGGAPDPTEPPERAHHVLVFNIHHVVFDGWSTDVFLSELTALCRALAAGVPSPLAELRVQYADFAVWQRQWLRGEVLAGQLRYWRQQLADLPMPALATDRPRPEVPTYRGALESFRIEAALGLEVHRLAREGGLTLFMTLLAAFTALLGRCSGQLEAAVGSPVANRNYREIEPLVGFFVNTLVLRGSLRGDPTVGEFLARMRETALAAYAHQDVPFEQLVEELEPDRHLGQNPLAQVFFQLRNAAPPLTELLPGVELRAGGVSLGVAKFDLSLDLEEVGDGFLGAFEYNTDLFDATTIGRMSRLYGHLLAALVAAPERRVSELPLLSEVETQQLLREWNATTPTRAALSVDALIEARAARTPEAVALVGGREQLSYGELGARVHRLAQRLRALGVGAEKRVGVCMERTPEMVVALLATLKAGGAYVPLDPDYPAERREFMLRDSGVEVLLRRGCTRGCTHGWQGQAAPDVVRTSIDPPDDVVDKRVTACPCLLGQEQEPGQEQGQGVPVAAGGGISGPVKRSDESAQALPLPPLGNQLAYVIYTSGSTGTPKGVAVTHGALVRHCETIRRALALSAADRVLVSASFSFDVALEQTLPALVAGARLVLAGRDLWLPAELADRLRELGITVADLPAAYWQQWVEELTEAGGDPGSPGGGQMRGSPGGGQMRGSLRLVSVGGDVMPAPAAGRWPLAGVRLLNAYGPTEATITATAFAVPAAAAACAHRVPIGRPLAGRAVYVLDRRGRPVPAGVAGELHLGGLLARGYLARPALTAERFVPNPLSGDPGGGERLYRTGDLARLRGDGCVDFLGRVDHQVKVRGFRIELGEIEAVLAAHPAIEEGAVVAADDRLVAYAAAAAAPTAAQMRAFMQKQLPSYMVPGVFVFLDRLPRLAGGKVDRAALARRALPAAERTAPERAAAQDPHEEIIARIWAEVLGCEAVGVDEDFFALGGHSLLATRVVARMRRQLEVEPPLRLLFEQPTVAALARWTRDAVRRRAGMEAPPLRPMPSRDAIPLSFAQQRLWFLDRFEPGSALYNIPSFLRLRGALDPALLAAALTEIVRRHQVLRTSFALAGDVPVQVIHPATAVALPLVDLAALDDREREAAVERLGRAEAQTPFDLGRGPLMRALFLRLSPTDQVLVVNVHHIVFDGWSTDVFLHELTVLCRALSEGVPAALPELEVQYADFAVWQRQWLRGEVLERQLAYWRRRLAKLPLLDLPIDRPRPAMQSHRGAGVDFVLEAALGSAVARLGQAQGTTSFMTLGAAFMALLGRWSGQGDLAVGSPVANRNHAEIEPLIGFFVNTLVLRGDLGGDPAGEELLARVRAAALGAYAHQDVPFEQLVEELEPERNLSQNPLVQVLFLHQSAPLEVRELMPGVASSAGGTGRRRLPSAGGGAGIQPLRPVGRHHLLDLRPNRAREHRGAADRPAA